MRPANERQRYFVMTSFIGWVQTQNQPWEYNGLVQDYIIPSVLAMELLQVYTKPLIWWIEHKEHVFQTLTQLIHLKVTGVTHKWIS